jgi:hypothetical protein
LPKIKDDNAPDYCEPKPVILSAKTIASDPVHPAAALVGGLSVVFVYVRSDIDVHLINRIAEFRVVFRRAIFKFPLISGDVMSRNGHVERAVYE